MNELSNALRTGSCPCSLALALFLLSPRAATGDVVTVNSSSDNPDATVDETCDTGLTNAAGDPECTFRAALDTIHAIPGSDVIEFDIPLDDEGCDASTMVCTITGSLNPVINEPLFINGYSQPGAAWNTMEIGSNAQIKIKLAQISLEIRGGDAVLQGLIFDLVSELRIQSNDNHVEGNFFGTDPTGTMAGGGFSAIRLECSSSAGGNVIGGPLPRQRNLISNHSTTALQVLDGCLGNSIINNYIGTNAAGTAAIPNLQGVRLTSDNSVTGNLISGNFGTGIGVVGRNNLIRDNLIGTAADGVTPLGNGTASGGPGIGLASSTAAVAFNTIENNVIAFNAGDGVAVITQGATNNVISMNSIYENGASPDDLGVDLGDDGQDPLDVGGTDNEPNKRQNHPVLQDAVLTDVDSVVTGFLDDEVTTDFTLQFFANRACETAGFGEGEYFLGEAQVATDNFGRAQFADLVIPGVAPPGYTVVTATATDPGGNTSEFSNCIDAPQTLAVDLRITKNATPAEPAVGQGVTYAIAVSHDTQSADATQVTVVDDLPDEVTFVTASSDMGNGCMEDAGTVTCDLGDLPLGSSATIDIEVEVNTAASFTNTAVVDSNESDTDEDDNSADATVNAVTADLSITDSIAPVDDRDLPFGLLLIGSERSETLTLRNDGAEDIVIDLDASGLPSDPFFIDDPSTCFGQTLAPASSCVLAIRYAPQQSGDFAAQFEIAFGAFAALIQVSGRAGEGMADLTVGKSSSNPLLGVPGDTTTFSIVATNNGPDDVPMVEVLDLMPPQLTIPAGMTWSAEQGAYDPDTGIWTVGELTNGASPVLEIPVELLRQSGECIVNRAAIESADPSFADSMPENDAVSIGVNGGCTDLVLTSEVASSELVSTVTLFVSNSGPDNALDVTLETIRLEPVENGIVSEPDPLPAGFSVASGETREVASFNVSGQNGSDGAEYEFSISTSQAEVSLDNNTVAGSIRIIPESVPEFDTGSSSSCPSIALLGGPNHPGVGVLRDFRDKVLRRSAPGRWLIEQYYANAESVTGALEAHPWLRSVGRVFIVAVVVTIQHPGIVFSVLIFSATALLARRRLRRRTARNALYIT